MRTWMEVGVAIETGEEIPTKKRLRELVRDDPLSLRFYPVSVDWTGEPVLKTDFLDTTNAFSIAGPDPWHNRRWYASLKLDRGKLRID